MGGLAAIFFIGLYLFIAFKVVQQFRTSRYKWPIVVLLVLIPSADAVVGRIYLKHLCAEEAGLAVRRVVVGVEGFMNATFSDGDGSWVKKHGYAFTEYAPVIGRVTRYSKRDGQIIREENVTPQSQYYVRSPNIGNPKNIYFRHQFLIDTSQGEILATDTQIAFNGGWVERFIALFSDAGGGAVAWCTNTELDPVVRHKRIVLDTLKH